MADISTRCCIAGGGPAGMMLGLLLARAGIDVVVLEKHADFLRDFRGDTVHPSTKPHYLPNQAIVDFRLEKTFKLPKYGSLNFIVDVFNLFNSNTPNSIEYQFPFGSVRGVLTPRTYRLSFLYQF